MQLYLLQLCQPLNLCKGSSTSQLRIGVDDLQDWIMEKLGPKHPIARHSAETSRALPFWTAKPLVQGTICKHDSEIAAKQEEHV